MLYIGLDVHQKSTTICIQDADGTELVITDCPTDEAGFRDALGVTLKENPGTLVGMESCAKAYVVSGIIEWLEGIPLVIAADEVASKTRSKKKKNDRRDARDLCTNLRTGALQRIVQLPPPAMRHLRSLLQTRNLLDKQQVQVRNAAKAVLREYGLAYATGPLFSASHWAKRLDQEMPEVVRLILEIHRDHTLWLRAKIDALSAEIVELAATNEAFAVVETIPGIGPITRAALAAYLFDIERFDGPKKVSAYVGLCPSSYDSGERRQGGRITREGPSILRGLLTEAAQQTARLYHPLNPYYRKFARKHGHKKAIVAMANKLCRIVYALVKNQEAFDPAQLGVERAEGGTMWFFKDAPKGPWRRVPA